MPTHPHYIILLLVSIIFSVVMKRRYEKLLNGHYKSNKDCYYHIAPNFRCLKICDFRKLFLDHKIYFQGDMTGIKKFQTIEICSYMVYHHYYY